MLQINIELFDQFITYFDNELKKVKEFKRLHILKAKSNRKLLILEILFFCR